MPNSKAFILFDAHSTLEGNGIGASVSAFYVVLAPNNAVVRQDQIGITFSYDDSAKDIRERIADAIRSRENDSSIEDVFIEEK